jgi:flagellar basal-body rod modification protein FlgD
MTVSSATNSAAQVNSTATTATTKTAADDVQADTDKFMKLLVTQLQNQDPLNPMDNAAMTSQLAQLSTVTGINKVNATLESLRADQAAASSANAINLIGKGVLVAGQGVSLSSTKNEDGTTSQAGILGVDLASAAQNVEINIQNSSGQTVYTINMPNADVGTYPIPWSGITNSGTQAPDGDYTFTVKATSAGSVLSDATPLQLASVASVSTGSGGVKLNTSLGHYSLSDIKEVL